MVRHWVKHSADEVRPIEEAVAEYVDLIAKEYCFLVCDDMTEGDVAQAGTTEGHHFGEMNLAPQAEIIGIGHGRSLAQTRVGFVPFWRSGYGLAPR